MTTKVFIANAGSGINTVVSVRKVDITPDGKTVTVDDEIVLSNGTNVELHIWGDQKIVIEEKQR